jgi:hypothetical protein
MKYLIIVLFTFLIGCVSSNRPIVDAEPRQVPDFSGLVESYISFDKSAQKEDQSVIIVHPETDDFTPPKPFIPILEQPEIKKSLNDFTCPVRGKVAVAVLLDTNGDILKPQIRRGIHPLCDSKALEIASKAKIKPAKLNGEPAAMVLTLPIWFN